MSLLIEGSSWNTSEENKNSNQLGKKRKGGKNSFTGKGLNGEDNLKQLVLYEVFSPRMARKRKFYKEIFFTKGKIMINKIISYNH